jgi:hypothetical protein
VDALTGSDYRRTKYHVQNRLKRENEELDDAGGDADEKFEKSHGAYYLLD